MVVVIRAVHAEELQPIGAVVFDFLDPRYPAPQHICEVTYDLIRRGALTLDKSGNADKVVTFHDSCNVSRGSRMGDVPGGQFTIPREIIRACVDKFVDMAPESIGESTFCCGGGGACSPTT